MLFKRQFETKLERNRLQKTLPDKVWMHRKVCKTRPPEHILQKIQTTQKAKQIQKNNQKRIANTTEKTN